MHSGEQWGFLSLKQLSRTQLLQGLNLQPLAYTRITLTTQPWWHRSPFCHTSLIASLHPANLCSSLNPLRGVCLTLLTIAISPHCLSTGKYQPMPALSLRFTRGTAVFPANMFLYKSLPSCVCLWRLLPHREPIKHLPGHSSVDSYPHLDCCDASYFKIDLFWILVFEIYANAFRSACSVKMKR